MIKSQPLKEPSFSKTNYFFWPYNNIEGREIMIFPTGQSHVGSGPCFALAGPLSPHTTFFAKDV
jgi:hypothetical protein